MNLDDLTIGQAKELASMFFNARPSAGVHPLVGKYAIARCYAAGVHAGEVVSVDGENVLLKDSRRLWFWKAKDGIALSGVAQKGVETHECKIDILNPIIYLTGLCELIPCTEISKDSINA